MSLPTAARPDHQRLGVALAGPGGELLSASAADDPFYAASTIKLHVLAAVLRAGDAGLIDLDATQRARRTFTGEGGAPFTLEGDHLDPTHPADGAPITIRELAVRMIDRSSNEATDHLIGLVGLDAVAAVIRDLGLTGTRVERLIGDASALEAGRTNETTAADLVRTVHALAVGPLPGTSFALSDAARAFARDALAAQRIRIIADALRPGIPVGSKSGWVDGYRHDVAVIGNPDGPDVRVLAVMTAGIEQGEADVLIREQVRTLLPDLARMDERTRSD